MSKLSKPESECQTHSTTIQRRAMERFATVREASCAPIVALRTGLNLRIRDLSKEGIGLLSPRRFERGTLLLIEVQDDDRGVALLLMGKVIYVMAETSGHWLIGCELARELAEAEVQAQLGGGPAIAGGQL